MTRDALLLLRGARARCANGGWSGVPAALDRGRLVCDPRAEEATYFDIAGSLFAGNQTDSVTFDAWEALDEFARGLITWEDTPGRTEADVLALFDRAIARATALSRKGNQ